MGNFSSLLANQEKSSFAMVVVDLAQLSLTKITKESRVVVDSAASGEVCAAH